MPSASTHHPGSSNAPPPPGGADSSTSSQASDSNGLATIPLDQLKVGHRLGFPVFGRGGVLLLGAGVQITHRFISRLRQLGILEVQLPEGAVESPREAAANANRQRAARELDEMIEFMRRSEMTMSSTVRTRHVLTAEQLSAETQRGWELHERAVHRVADISQEVLRGRQACVSAAADVVSGFLDINLDSSLLPAVARLKDTPGEYLYHHGLNVALLSMAVASQLSVRRENLLQIGIGALLMDVGMLQVPEDVRLAARELSAEERRLVQSHPLHTINALERLEAVGPLSMLICYQSHERADGSGYPKGRTADTIHPYAKLVGAADAYVAISSNRPYRGAATPYKAMETVLREAGRSLFDREVFRSLLDCLSLFPIGSYVRLSSGDMAKVIRANPGMHTRPVVLIVDDDGTAMDTELDLSRTPQIQVIEAAVIPAQFAGAA